MARKLIQKLLPDPAVIRENKSLQFLGEHLLDPNLWHLNRRSAALAFFVGVFVCFIPMPFQMVLAAFLALLVRCNLPLSVALVWISNPVTMPVMFYFTYKIGCYILQTPVSSEEFHMNLQWLHHEIGRIWMPLYAGSLITGLVVATLSYFGIRLFWRWHIIRSWKQRKKRKANP
ncbi:DUF2062 domain-containing protein [Sansalvadorimonas sp. 2012CJ34-2]|uniref:DUF2062 domain-containing protein n=1 Tax=Parendozoicomonas callyspongiae TaxID=2942213 RepID=A0ABT0PEJ7_9GAMM|nr:DUF2062 domain-containing protein [Sansalvadorimonas sp. 2012CJ34-2]MCL6269790.1 DUF2062 domain-containing protein [Sansalvadorimonas sp. 2012CJ34-2]